MGSCAAAGACREVGWCRGKLSPACSRWRRAPPALSTPAGLAAPGAPPCQRASACHRCAGWSAGGERVGRVCITAAPSPPWKRCAALQPCWTARLRAKPSAQQPAPAHLCLAAAAGGRRHAEQKHDGAGAVVCVQGRDLHATDRHSHAGLENVQAGAARQPREIVAQHAGSDGRAVQQACSKVGSRGRSAGRGACRRHGTAEDRACCSAASRAARPAPRGTSSAPAHPR